jgi:outer membrane protein TolC
MNLKAWKQSWVYWILIMLMSQSLAAQQAESLSLEEALQFAETRNYDIRIAEAEADAAKAMFTQSNAVFLPEIGVEGTAVQTTDPISAFGIKLRQKSITAADFNPALLNDPDAISNFNTRLFVNQPLFNLDRFFERSAASSMFEAAAKKAESVKFYQQFMVKEHYYRIILLKEKRHVIANGLKLAQAIEKQSQDYFDEGIINKAELLEAQVLARRTEEELLRTDNEIRNTIDEFSTLIGQDLSYELQLTTALEADGSFSPDVEDQAIRNSGLEALALQMGATEASLKSSKFKFVPRLNLFGAYEFNDEQLLGLNNENYTFGASLRWDIFKGGRQIYEVKQKQAQLRSMQFRYDQESEKLANRIRKTERSVEEAAKRIDLNRLSAEQAEEDFKIRSNRYEQGLEKTSDLLRSETQMVEQQLMLLQARYEYIIHIATLEFLNETEL